MMTGGSENVYCSKRGVSAPLFLPWLVPLKVAQLQTNKQESHHRKAILKYKGKKDVYFQTADFFFTDVVSIIVWQYEHEFCIALKKYSILLSNPFPHLWKKNNEKVIVNHKEHLNCSYLF